MKQRLYIILFSSIVCVAVIEIFEYFRLQQSTLPQATTQQAYLVYLGAGIIYGLIIGLVINALVWIYNKFSRKNNKKVK